MSDIIRLLPDAIANQIAAGEVVQRPASVVKELLENAIDAQSTNIQVFIKDAGKSLIQIIDNGIGMSETDARMSFERHATSKIQRSEDLFSIRTMGFRGEALASIAAVAQVEMKTCQVEQELGTLLCVEGSQIKMQEPIVHARGTSVSVKNLFFNVPARRNFLKSNPVEMKHIIDEFQRVALAHPDISFSLYQNEQEVYVLNGGKLSQRIVGLFGKNYKEQLAACHEETPHITVEGYIGKPEFAKKTRGEQFFFVNKRFIKSSYLNHAVQNAYEGLIKEDNFPFYVLFIEIDPKHIDINVHPTKTEIKFDDERTIYGIIRAAVRQALGTHNFTPSLDFDYNVNFDAFSATANPTSKPVTASIAHQKSYEQFKSSSNPRQEANLRNWERLYPKEQTGAGHEDVDDLSSVSKPVELTFESAANSMSTPQTGGFQIKVKDENCGVYQLHNTYIVTQVKSGMMLIDQHAAHERILYEKYLHNLDKKQGASQQFLFPLTIELNPGDFSLVMELEEEIKSLGFDFSIFGKNAIVVNGCPADASGMNEQELFEGLIEQFKKNKSELSLSKQENIARAMAQRSAIKRGTKLSAVEMNALIDQLFGCKNPNYAPNGQLTFFILDLEKIANFFK
jgi:DNA mismatch repair protein MutL